MRLICCLFHRYIRQLITDILLEPSKGIPLSCSHRTHGHRSRGFFNFGKKWHRSGTDENKKVRKRSVYGRFSWCGWWDLKPPTQVKEFTQSVVNTGLFGFLSKRVFSTLCHIFGQKWHKSGTKKDPLVRLRGSCVRFSGNYFGVYRYG